MDDLNCRNCGEVLMIGKASTIKFGKGVTLSCHQCGERYIFDEETEDKKVGIDLLESLNCCCGTKSED